MFSFLPNLHIWLILSIQLIILKAALSFSLCNLIASKFSLFSRIPLFYIAIKEQTSTYIQTTNNCYNQAELYTQINLNAIKEGGKKKEAPFCRYEEEENYEPVES